MADQSGNASFDPSAWEPSNRTTPLSVIWSLLGRHIAFHRRLVDLTDNVNIYGHYIANYSKTFGLSKLDDSPGTIVIKADNPFIPASVAAQMTSADGSFSYPYQPAGVSPPAGAPVLYLRARAVKSA